MWHKILLHSLFITSVAIQPAISQVKVKAGRHMSKLSLGDIPTSFKSERVGFEFVKRVEEIQMRDGVKLHTVIIIPRNVKRAPILLDRTPYSADEFVQCGDESGGDCGAGGPLLGQNLFPGFAEMAERGYIIVAQDVRGKFASGGDYVMNRPLRGPLNSTNVDHSTDAYDTIDWLVKHVPESNGRVATIGASYDGFTALMSLIDPHPALKASVPMNPMVDGWKGDDWFHNGAFRQEMMSYIYSQTAKKDSSEEWYPLGYDDYDTFLRYGSAGAFGKAVGMEQLPFWRRLTQHPAYDAFWQDQAVDRLLKARSLKVPTLIVGSLWDQEDIYGAPAVYNAVKDQAKGNVHLVLGPWSHAQEGGSASKLGALDWGSDTGKWFRDHVMIPFLDTNLKDQAPKVDIPVITVYETGTNHWTSMSEWPAVGTIVPFYFNDNGRLSLKSEGLAVTSYDEYVSNPSKPVTYRPRPNQAPYVRGSNWDTWLVDDQRFAAARPDVLVYTTDVLTQPVHIAGRPQVDLFASTSGTDSDWVVKIIDVYPDIVTAKPAMGGYQFPISMDILRGRYRDDPSHPTAIPSNQVVHYSLSLPNADHVFLPGHRIMVQIQSSWFPLYDRNPQTFVPNIFFGRKADYRVATQRIYRSPRAASSIQLPLVQ